MDNNFKPFYETQLNISFHNSTKNNGQTESSLNSKQQNNQSELNKNIYIQNLENSKSISLKNKNKSLNSQADKQQQGIPNIEYQNIIEIGYFDQIGYSTYRMLTKRKGKRNETSQDDLEQQTKQFEDVCIIYQNESTIVDIKFDTLLKDFIVTKQNLIEKEFFEKECKILELLKGLNVTLDIVSTIEDNCSFQQISGKTNLFFAKQKNIGKQMYQTFFFILFDKLKKMHEKGIAHSDIKPQNIVLSFDNEPYFIDFGGSILLSDENDYKNYLMLFTPQYNLKKYYKKFKVQNKIKYQSKQLESKEEIILCDMVQLCLTFLYLICEDDFQENLFFTNQYNQLFSNIIHNKQNKCEQSVEYYSLFMKYNNRNIDVNYQKTNMMFLFHISRILNLADPDINIIEYQKKQIFEIDVIVSEIELNNLSDIVFYDDKKIYVVFRIDKFNIWFIYFLHKQGYKLQIDPKNIYITPIPKMKEYEFISQKYKIDQYFQQLANKIVLKELYGKQIFNLCQCITAYQIRNLDISSSLNNPNQVLNFLNKLKSLKLLYPLELKFKFEILENGFSLFIKILKKQFSIFCVQSFEIFRDGIIMKTIGEQIT